MRARRVAGRRSPSWVDVAMAQAAEVSTDNIRLSWREGGGDVTLDVDPQDPHFTGNAVGLAYVRQNGHLITGARLVFRDLKWVKTNVVIHEVGHFLGFEHSVEGRDIMTGIYVWTGRPFFTDGERWAMNMMLQRSLGNTYPDTAPGMRTQESAPDESVIVCGR